MQAHLRQFYWFCKFWVHVLFRRNYIDKVAWMPVQNRHILFARSKKEPVIFYNVGGKIEQFDKTKVQALIREVGEEANVNLVLGSITHDHTIYGPSKGIPMRMTFYKANYRGNLSPGCEVAELAWFTTKDKNRTTVMGRIGLDWYCARGLID